MRIVIGKKEREISICEHCENYAECNIQPLWDCIFHSMLLAYLDDDTSILKSTNCYMELWQLGELIRKYLEDRRTERQ